ncbi:MAG: hypothetical protein JXB30_05950 [Anaerolineae bacterium]|nr:hypothetical protein [Anaerolineae bacterium]
MFEPYKLPENPPALDQHIAVSQQDAGKIYKVITKLSQEIELLPVVLSQEGEVIAFAELPNATSAEHIAKLIGRIWHEGAHRQARELIRFEEETIDEADDRTNVMLYSTHITGAITLTIGWHVSISLTQIRAEVNDVKIELLRILGAEEG